MDGIVSEGTASRQQSARGVSYQIARSAGFQPEGLTDSSRWSERSEDHRKIREENKHPGRVPEKLPENAVRECEDSLV
jgi:hypothetical protein